MLGVHLEGPYLNPARLGAQPDFATTATLAEVLGTGRMAAAWFDSIEPGLAVPGRPH